MLCEEVNDTTASLVVAQLLYLEGQDPDKDISLYINSPGGSISAGMAIYDTMQYIKCDVSTICVGMAASMGAFLLSSGAKGKRFALPNSEVVIHQPLGGAQGQASDVKDPRGSHHPHPRETEPTVFRADRQPLEVILPGYGPRQLMSADEALAYGLVDRVITKRQEV